MTQFQEVKTPPNQTKFGAPPRMEFLLLFLLLSGPTMGLDYQLFGRNEDVEVSNNQLESSLAQEAFQHLEMSSNNYYGRKITNVLSVSQQTVNGKLYTVKLELATTKCPKPAISHCDINEDVPREDCKAKIWRQPWLNLSQVIEAKCLEKPVIKQVDPPIEDFRPLLDAKSSMRALRKLQSHHSFKAFVKRHGKDYKSKEEYERRFSIFKANMKKVQFLRETERGSGAYGATIFADLTEEEFKRRHLGLNDPLNPTKLPKASVPDIDLPTKFDWRQHGAVTPVKNQGSCGSCWAFSVTGNVEGLWKIKTGKLLSLSEQELVDCDSTDHGCEGGLPENAYKAINKLGGLESEDDYKYEGDDEKCHFDKAKVKATVSGGVSIPKNETQMAQWLVKHGPISIGLNANAMQFYMGGVSHPWSFLCSKDGIDHGVLIVGYGIHHYPMFRKDMPFWIIKNSWGPGWGESGYYRLYRGDGACGVNEMATSAVL